MRRRLQVSPTCKRKWRYPDEMSARLGAMKAMNDHQEQDQLYVYKCVECFGWHLTKKKQAEKYRVTPDNPVASAS